MFILTLTGLLVLGLDGDILIMVTDTAGATHTMATDTLITDMAGATLVMDMDTVVA
jgi:hypothetical protein